MTTALWVLLWVVVIGLMLGGLGGTVLPILPGPVLIPAGAALYAVATGFTPIDGWRLGILTGLAVLAYALAHPLMALGARRFGASAWAIWGALLGALVGILFAPVGLVLGPMIGAVVGELIRTRELRQSLRSGLGALVGILFSGLVTLGLALAMVALFFWWVWRG